MAGNYAALREQLVELSRASTLQQAEAMARILARDAQLLREERLQLALLAEDAKDTMDEERLLLDRVRELALHSLHDRNQDSDLDLGR